MLRASIFLILACCAQPASAQTATSPFPTDHSILYRPDVAGTRPLPLWSAGGLNLGGLKAWPSVGLTAAADSNIFNVDSGKKGDAYLAIEPSLRLLSNWNLHEISLDAKARVERFAALTAQNNETFDANASGRLDFAAHGAAYGLFGYGREVEPRGAGGLSLLGTKPASYRQLQATAGAAGEFGPLRSRGALTLVTRRYNDLKLDSGRTFDLSFRDVRVLSLAARIEYALTPNASLLLSGTGTDINALAGRPFGARNSRGGVIGLGVHAEVTPLLIGEVTLGWRTRQFSASQYKDFSGFTYAATIDWYPTTLLSLRFKTDQDFENSGLTAVAGILARTTSLAIYHELLRNLRLTGRAEQLNEKYREVSIHTRLRQASLSANYAFNRYLSAELTLQGRKRTSSQPDIVGRYSGATVQCSLRMAI